jgi:hypothetical protein
MLGVERVGKGREVINYLRQSDGLFVHWTVVSFIWLVDE